jgi:proton glutamate symport protein
MKIYTKILLGMIIGAVVGLTLGPTSELLEHDLYKVADGSRVHLRLDRQDAASELPLPEGVGVSLKVIEVLNEERKDAAGVVEELPAWARVSFRYTQRFALAASPELTERLGKPKARKKLEAWLRIDAKPLDTGGFLLEPRPVSSLGDTIISWLQPIGVIFMRLITMVIVPLVFCSLVVGVASLGDVRRLGRLGGRTIGLYLCTTAIAVTIGLLCAHVVNPGGFVDEKDRVALQSSFSAAAGDKVSAAAQAPSTLDNIVSIVPTNPVESLSSGNMLQIIFFATIFGIALTLVGAAESKIVVTFLDRVQQAMVMIIHIVMQVAPYGVAALVAEVIGTSGVSVLASLLVYTFTVLFGLLLQAVLVYGGLVKFVAKLPFMHFLKAIRPAQLLGFSTSSSSATLPVSLECAEENLGVSQSVSSFVLPLGSTVNMDGTALYQGVAAVFIAQVFNMDLDLTAQLGIVLTATMASVGAAGVPGAGMVTLALVLTTAGIPTVGVALILGMDRLLDMFRTSVNVTGDLAVTCVMAVGEGENVRVLSEEDDDADTEKGFERRLDHDEERIAPEEPKD